MSSTPETPFLLTRWTRYTPTFQTSGDDADLGADGIATGSWFIIGHTMFLRAAFFLAGSGASPGTGNLLIPFPPGYSKSDLDIARCPVEAESEGAMEAVLGVLVNASIGAGKSVREAVAQLTTDGATPPILEAEIVIDGLATLDDGDSLFVSIEFPLKEPALPG